MDKGRVKVRDKDKEAVTVKDRAGATGTIRTAARPRAPLRASTRTQARRVPIRAGAKRSQVSFVKEPMHCA